MEYDYSFPQRQPIRAICLHAVVEGQLGPGALVRTLDELNVPTRDFLVIHAPRITNSEWSFEDDAVAVRKSSILFVVEPMENPHKSDGRVDARQYRRVPVRLYVGDYCIRGFLHSGRGGDPMKRLNQRDHAFIAITSASVSGPQMELQAPFAAVNISRICAVQTGRAEEPASEEVSTPGEMFEKAPVEEPQPD